MARTFEMNGFRKASNKITGTLIGAGLIPGPVVLLATRGRKTGELHTTPVVIQEQEGERWLVSPYGEVDWARNIRANPRIQLKNGAQVESLEAYEADPEQAAPILHEYARKIPFVRSFIGVDLDAPDEAFAEVVPNHPVFKIVSPGS